MLRRAIGIVGLAAVAWLGCTRQPLAPRVQPPRNVILISLDTLRADHLGLFGYERDTSPHLDRLALRSTVFRRAVSQSHSTVPSHGALLTSLYYSAFKPKWGLGSVPESVETLAEILGRTGFATAGFVDGGNMRRLFGFGQGFGRFEEERVGLKRILAQAQSWIEGHSAERFFLFLHTYDIHTPYSPPHPYRLMFVDKGYRKRFRPNTRLFRAIESGKLSITREDLEYIVASYDGGIRYVDTQLQGLFEWLESKGLLDDTMIVIVADHGEEFLEHGRFGHEQVYFMPNLHVPLLFYVPGHAPRLVDETVELVDVMPTILELLGLPPHAPAMGRSLVSLIDGKRPSDVDAIAFAQPTAAHSTLRTVVSGRHQLFHDLRTGRTQLYDLEVDPEAAVDVAEREPEIVARLLKELRRREEAATVVRRALAEVPPPVVNRKIRRELEALGYVVPKGSEEQGRGAATPER
jgi:arylsulfatase A-like enzyme